MSENSHFNKANVGLLVIRSKDMERAAHFYMSLGLTMVKHSHPPCGEHYATTEGSCVFEICQRKAMEKATTGLVFGFNVPSVDDALQSVCDHGGIIKRMPEDQEWGKSATIIDLDGNSVILMQK